MQNSGSFTQLVWRESREVGFGVAGAGANIYIVALYYPGGNIVGSYVQNVLPPSNYIYPTTLLPVLTTTSRTTKAFDKEKFESILNNNNNNKVTECKDCVNKDFFRKGLQNLLNTLN
jgi:hypothetical protein